MSGDSVKVIADTAGNFGTFEISITNLSVVVQPIDYEINSKMGWVTQDNGSAAILEDITTGISDTANVQIGITGIEDEQTIPTEFKLY